jgi:hypothetical protein
MESYNDHWHLTLKSEAVPVYRFLTIIDTRNVAEQGVVPLQRADGIIEVGDWEINCNLSGSGKSSFLIKNKNGNAHLNYTGGTPNIKDGAKVVELADQLPRLEI